MGARGAGAFENDDAMDWARELDEGRDAGFVARALVAGDGGYLWASEGSVVVAAAEVVAALAGRPDGALPDEVVRWAGEDAGEGVDGETVGLALGVVGRVRHGPGSELEELWDESGDPGDWHRAVDDLLARLGRGAPASRSHSQPAFVRLCSL